MATPHTLNLATPGMARICLHGDLQRFGRRFSLSIKTGAEAIYALAMQIPGFRQKMNDGWYQIRIAGQDVDEASVSARLHESLPDGAIIHIVPRMAGAGKGGLFQVVLGAVAIGASFLTGGATLALWGSALSAGAISASSVLFSMGVAMMLGGVAQMLTPRQKSPHPGRPITADRTPIFRHWTTWWRRVMPCRCYTVKCWSAPARSPRKSARGMKVVVDRW